MKHSSLSEMQLTEGFFYVRRSYRKLVLVVSYRFKKVEFDVTKVTDVD